MANRNLREWLEIGGSLLIVASLVFVGLEIRQSRQIGIMDQLGVFAEMQRDFRSMVAENADVWRRGCMDESLTPEEQVTFVQLYTQYEATTFTSIMRGNVGLYEGSDRWFENFAANIHRFPGLRKAFEKNGGMSSMLAQDLSELPSSAAAMREYFERLDAQVPDPNPDPSWCGAL